MKKLYRSPVAKLPIEMENGALTTFNMGHDNVAYASIALKQSDDHSSALSNPGSLKTIPTVLPSYRLIGMGQYGCVLDMHIEQVAIHIHHVQPLGDDLLLECNPCHQRPEDFERNGRVYGRDGVLRRELLLGDGIQDIQTSPAAEIWTSYNDEGVLRTRGRHSPVGASGLVAWSDTGERRYEYSPPAGLGSMLDCYALNVTSTHDVWCYYYTDFPLVHLHRHRVKAAWEIPVHYSQAFAVGRNHALFAGSHKAPEVLHLIRLIPKGKALLIGEYLLCDESGEPIVATFKIGRGESIWMLDAQGYLYRVDLREVC